MTTAERIKEAAALLRLYGLYLFRAEELLELQEALPQMGGDIAGTTRLWELLSEQAVDLTVAETYR
jgi:hypothetical protein